jgi:hypothetical protein
MAQTLRLQVQYGPEHPQLCGDQYDQKTNRLIRILAKF